MDIEKILQLSGGGGGRKPKIKNTEFNDDQNNENLEIIQEDKLEININVDELYDSK